MNKIPSDALKQIKANQARRRGLIPLENCNICGMICDPATQTVVTLYRARAWGITIHQSCKDAANV